MAIIYSYPLNQPKRDDLLIGTITYDEDAVNPVHGNPTVSFTIGSLLDLVSGQGNAQNLQQVTNIGNTTTNSIVISNNLLVSGGYYDSSNQPGTAGQLLSSTATGTQWVNVAAQGVTSVGLSMPAAFTVANSPITQAGILAVTGAGTAAQYIDGTGALQTFTSYEKWILAGDTGVQDVTTGQTASILGGTDIATVVTSPRTLTINHSAVTRSNTTATASPNPGDTVNLVSLVSSSVTGHVTGVETTTVTWPANQNTTYTIDVPATTTSINLKGSDSTDDPIALIGGTNITITRDSDSSLTWDSLNTEYTAGIGLTLNTLEFDVNVDATAGNAPESLSTDASRTYAIQLDNNSTNLVVNVPWDDTIQTITGTGTDNTDSGVLLSDSGGTVLILGSGSVTAAQTGNTITLTGTDTGVTGVTLATADSAGAPLVESITNRELTLTSAKYIGGANVGYVPEGGTSSTYLKGDGTWEAIPTGLIFKGTWDASGGSGGSPDLTLAANKGAGFLWICDVAGTAYPNGGTNEPSTWALGDWCVYDGSAWTRVPATNSGVTSITTTDGTYIDLTPNAATTGAVTVTADLNATGTQNATTFLRGDNTWDVPSYTVDTTYTIDVPSATTSINLKGSDGTDDAIVLTGGTNVTLSRTDASTIDIAATNTTYTAGNGLNLSGTVFSADINNTQANAATQALDASPPANRFYAIQLDNNATVADADLVVNIPWTDTQNPNQTLLGVGSDNTNSGVILNESGGTVLILGATGVAASQATNTVTLTGTTYDINFQENAGASPQVNPFLRLTGTGTASGTTDLEIVGTGATTVTRNSDSKITINSAAGSYSWKARDNGNVDKEVLNGEYLKFVTATGALNTALTGAGSNTDPYVMTLTSPNDNDNTTSDFFDVQTGNPATNDNPALRLDPSTGNNDDITLAGGSNMTITRDSDTEITFTAANDNTLYDLAGAASATAGEYNLVLSADSTAQDTMVFKQGSNVTFTRAANLLTIQSKWDQNTKTDDGYVPAPGAVANQVWKTNADGVPGWRDDATGDNTTYTIGSDNTKVITLTGSDSSTSTVTFADGNDISISGSNGTITIASTYTLPLAADGTRGGVQIGYTQTATRDYPVTLDSEKMLVTVPWTDNNDNTTYSISIPASTTKLRLTGANPTSTDDVEFVGGGITTVTRTDANKFTITSTEADTLQSVTARGDTTNQRILMNGSGSDAYLYVAGNAANNQPTNNQGMAFSYNNNAGLRENELFWNPGIVTAAENATYSFSLINEYLDSANSNARVSDRLFKLYGNGILELTGPTATSTIANTFWRMPTTAAPGTGYYLSKASGSENLVWTAPPTTGDITSVTAGTGMTGGGTSGGVTLNVIGGNGITANANDITMSGSYTGDLTITGDAVTDSYRFRANHSNPTTSTATLYDQSNVGATISAYRFAVRNSDGTNMLASALFTDTSLTVVGDVIAFGSPSDVRLKENVKPIESALDKVTKLQGVTFDWKKSDSILDVKEDIGFIAQDVQKVIPELVRENKDGMLSMRHQGIAPILLEAIKELKAEIEELKSNKCNCNK